MYCTWALSEFGEDYQGKGSDFYYYYGQYSGFYVLKFSGFGFTFSDEIIDGLNFTSPGIFEIYAFSESYGCTLSEAYERGFLTRSELEEIQMVHAAIFAYIYPFINATDN